jgi:hypothetical protein
MEEINKLFIQQNSMNEPNNSLSKKEIKKTHAQRFISFKQIYHRRRNEITNSQKSKVPTNKPNPLHFSQWHKYKKKNGLSYINTHLMGIKR